MGICMDRINGKKQGNIAGTLGTLIVIAVFSVLSLVLVNVGVRVYSNVVVANNNNFELRTSLLYIATKVRQCDQAGMVDVREIDGNNALVLTEELDGDTYETLIYYMDGAVYELTKLAGTEADLRTGFETIEIDGFTIEAPEAGLLRLTATNAAGTSEQLLLSLRSRD